MANHTDSPLESAVPPDPGLARVVLRHRGPPSLDARLPVAMAPASDAADGFRLLEYRLRHEGDARVIAVTSPERGEGKTTCAVNLAMAQAEHGDRHVLLVDVHFHSPALCELLGFEAPSCFAEQMHAGPPLYHWQAVAAFFSNLHVLAVNPATAKPPVLNGAAMRATVELLRQSRYDSIVLDCPPTLDSADMNVIADCVDGILLTSLAKRTRRGSLSRAAEILAPASVLGTVVMGAQ